MEFHYQRSRGGKETIFASSFFLDQHSSGTVSSRMKKLSVIFFCLKQMFPLEKLPSHRQRRATALSCVRQSIKSDTGLKTLVELSASLNTKILPYEFTFPLRMLKREMSSWAGTWGIWRKFKKNKPKPGLLKVKTELYCTVAMLLLVRLKQ